MLAEAQSDTWPGPTIPAIEELEQPTSRKPTQNPQTFCKQATPLYRTKGGIIFIQRHFGGVMLVYTSVQVKRTDLPKQTLSPRKDAMALNPKY